MILAGVLDQLHSVAGHLGQWVYVIVFVVSVLEAAAFLGLVVPGETILFLAGVLAYQKQIHLLPAMGLAVVGAIIGDSVGYEIGRHFGARLERSWLGRKVGPERWERARESLRHQGGKAIFVGRFVAIVRALLPAAAGDSRMPYGTFLPWNVAGGIVWGVLHVGIGYVAGNSYAKVEHYVGRATWGLLALLVAIWVVVHIVRRRRHGSGDDHDESSHRDKGRRLDSR